MRHLKNMRALWAEQEVYKVKQIKYQGLSLANVEIKPYVNVCSTYQLYNVYVITTSYNSLCENYFHTTGQSD